MDYFFVPASTLDSEEFVDSTPAQRGTWLFLLRYCGGQENSGRIEKAADFSDRKWQQLAGVTMKEVKDACPLWSWEGTTLVLKFYPIDKERHVQELRRIGRKGGIASGQARKSYTPDAAPDASPDAEANASSTPQPSGEAEGSANGGTDKKREDKRDKKREPAREKDPVIPSWEEFQAAFMADGIPEPYLRRQFERFQERRDWLNGRGELVDWARTVRNRWTKDRATWRPPATSASGTIAAGNPVSASVRRIALSKELTDVTAELNRLHSAEQPLPEKLRDRERWLKSEVAKLDAEGGAK